MRFRITLFNDTDSIEINEPDGIRDTVIKLDRDENFHSLVQFFEGAFIFYGSNDYIDGGFHFIKQTEIDFGPDADLRALIEIAPDDVTFSTLHDGQFKLSELEEMPDNKIKVPIIRDDFWAKFISRLDTQVNLKSATNLDDEVIAPAEHILLELPAQKIRYVGNYEWQDTFTYYEANDFLGDGMTGLQLDWDIVILDDLKKFTLPRARFQIGNISGVVLPNSIIGNFEAPYNGDYTFDIKLITSFYVEGPDIWSDSVTQIDFYVQKSNETVLTRPFTKAVVTCGSDSIVQHTFNQTLTLFRGEQVAIFGIDTSTLQNITVFGTQRLEWSNVVVASTGPLVLSGEQTVDDIVTSTSGILVKDQNDPAENGIYVTAAGAWTRASHADTASELTNAAVFVTLGTTNGDSAWKLSSPINTIDLDPQSWVFISLNDERLKPYPCSDEVDTHLIITGDTTFKKTFTEGFLLHDVGGAIIDRITGTESKFYSEFLGSGQTLYKQYDEDGCQWTNALARGLQIRQYSLTEKPFSISFKKWWDGANPILNLGLGYEDILGEQVIRVEEKQHFYDDSQGTSFDFSNVREIVRKYDNDRIFNKVEIGYAKWESEDISGIDDPQSKRIYASRFKKIGQTITLLSEFIGASLAWETTRRTTREKSADYKFDNEIFIVSINPTEVVESPPTSPDVIAFEPELSENFSSVTGLLNSETRYNIRHSVAHMFLRWKSYLQGCLQSYVGSLFKFTSGQGNFDMASTMDLDCDVAYNEGAEVVEDQDFVVGTEIFHLCNLYEFTAPLDYEDFELIVANRKLPIGLSQSSSDHTHLFIKSLSYKVAHSEVTIMGWPTEFIDIQVQDDAVATQECFPMPGACENAITDENGIEITDENGICITSS
jgi:hypothetical protein